MHDPPSLLQYAIMAKLPEPGKVNTRLAATGQFSEAQTASIGAAMLRCVVNRLRSRGPVTIAVTPDGCETAMAARLASADTGLHFTDQGPGTLGQRMARVWNQSAIASKPAAFFGIDSPDVPDTHLDQLVRAINNADVALGRTDDGGIWTLASRSPQPALLAHIDWGSEHVYDQLRQRAGELGLNVAALSSWIDVDQPADLMAMMNRISRPDHARYSCNSIDHLTLLHTELRAIINESPAGT